MPKVSSVLLNELCQVVISPENASFELALLGLIPEMFLYTRLSDISLISISTE